MTTIDPAAPERERYYAPPLAEIQRLDDDQLQWHAEKITEALASIEMQRVGTTGERKDKLDRALHYYQRAAQLIRQVREHRAGARSFVRAREVLDVESAIYAHKAISRMLGLLHDEHRAVAELLTADDPDAISNARALLEHRHGVAAAALDAGRAPTEEPEQ